MMMFHAVFSAIQKLVIWMLPLIITLVVWSSTSTILAEFAGVLPSGFLQALVLRAIPVASLAAVAALLHGAVHLQFRRATTKRIVYWIVGASALCCWFTLGQEISRLADIAATHSLFSAVMYFDPMVAMGVLLDAWVIRYELLRIKEHEKIPNDRVERGRTILHGDADWMPMPVAMALFDAGGMILGEAYRVDETAARGTTYDPRQRESWGEGGKHPLLRFNGQKLTNGHGIIIAGAGSGKTSSFGIPTALCWEGSLVYHDPKNEVAPVVSRHRLSMGRKVVVLDPSRPGAGFNAIGWLSPSRPDVETDIKSFAEWFMGEKAGENATDNADFFHSRAKLLISTLLADIVFNDDMPASDKNLATLRRFVSQPLSLLKAELQRIYEFSLSTFAREQAGALKDDAEEQMSGWYAMADNATSWLSIPAFAELVAGDDFAPADLCGGNLDLFISYPLKVLDTNPGLGRVTLGALMLAVYNADGAVKGQVLFAVDEAARLGKMGLLETVRDAGRSYGIILVMMYQSTGQLAKIWGRDGKSAWYGSIGWRSYAGITDGETAKEVSELCGEFTALNRSLGETTGKSVKDSEVAASQSLSDAEQKGEIAQRLIKPDAVIQKMRRDEQIIILGNESPIRCGRAFYYRRPEMLALTDANRFEQTGSAA
jgi:type IV secretion system protein VirD4